MRSKHANDKQYRLLRVYTSWRSRLICVYTFGPDMSVRKLRIISVHVSSVFSSYQHHAIAVIYDCKWSFWSNCFYWLLIIAISFSFLAFDLKPCSCARFAPRCIFAPGVYFGHGNRVLKFKWQKIIFLFLYYSFNGIFSSMQKFHKSLRYSDLNLSSFDLLSKQFSNSSWILMRLLWRHSGHLNFF